MIADIYLQLMPIFTVDPQQKCFETHTDSLDWDRD